MCGIAGVFGNPIPYPEMLDSLAHRGPDDRHLITLSKAWLGTTRLSIVDPLGGRQPLQAGDITLAMNGEIYNHSPLRKTLAGNGHEFETNCDTEVLAAELADCPYTTIVTE